MSKSSQIGKYSVQQLLLLALIGGVFITVVSAAVGDGGSRCPDAACTPAPPGIHCDPKYERDDGCCPVWYCSNGQTAYGVSKSSSSGNSFSFSSGSSSSSGLPAGGGIGGANPFAGMFGNLMGGMFG